MKRSRDWHFGKLNASSISTPSDDVQTCLEITANGDIDAFRDYITSHMDMVNAKDPDRGIASLHVCAGKNYTSLIEVLIRYGGNIDIQDMWGNSALLYAVENEHFEASEILLRSGAQVNRADNRGNTPLHSACKKGNLKITRLLLRYGADMDAKDFSNMKPNQYAVTSEITDTFVMENLRRSGKGVDSKQMAVNMMSIGVGLGVGMSLALTKPSELMAHNNTRQQETKSNNSREYLSKRKEFHERMRNDSLMAVQSFLSKSTFK